MPPRPDRRRAALVTDRQRRVREAAVSVQLATAILGLAIDRLSPDEGHRRRAKALLTRIDGLPVTEEARLALRLAASVALFGVTVITRGRTRPVGSTPT